MTFLKKGGGGKGDAYQEEGIHHWLEVFMNGSRSMLTVYEAL